MGSRGAWSARWNALLTINWLHMHEAQLVNEIFEYSNQAGEGESVLE